MNRVLIYLAIWATIGMGVTLPFASNPAISILVLVSQYSTLLLVYLFQPKG